jgi:CBS domain-containing protein
MTTTISQIMSKRLETIGALDSVQETAKKMKDQNVSSMVVVDKTGEPQGLITERDLVRKVCINDLPTSMMKNVDIMSSPLITINSNSSPSTAADMMLKNNVRHLLVIDNDTKSNTKKPVGIITPLDFTRYEEYTNDEERDNIEKILEYYI